jgi:hypothetical protein
MWHDTWVNRDSVGQGIGWSVITALESVRISLPIMLIAAVIGGAIGWLRGRHVAADGQST